MGQAMTFEECLDRFPDLLDSDEVRYWMDWVRFEMSVPIASWRIKMLGICPTCGNVLPFMRTSIPCLGKHEAVNLEPVYGLLEYICARVRMTQ